jgi:hypothetical protein
MDRRFLFSMLAGSVLTAAGAALIAAGPEGEGRSVGRYQIVSDAHDGIWLVDTATGQTWFRQRASNLENRARGPE